MRDRLGPSHRRFDQRIDRGPAMRRVDDVEPRQRHQNYCDRQIGGDPPDDPAADVTGLAVVQRHAGDPAPIDRAACGADRMTPGKPQRLDKFAVTRRAGEELRRPRIEELADRADVATRHQHQQCGAISRDQPAQCQRRRQPLVERATCVDQRDRRTARQKAAFDRFGIAHDLRMPVRADPGARQNLCDFTALTERYREQRRCRLHVFHIRRTLLHRCEPSWRIAPRQSTTSRSGLVPGTVRS